MSAAITSQSIRDFGATCGSASTPTLVGPGKYEDASVSTAAEYPPFNTRSKREVCAVESATPGPGEYLSVYKDDSLLNSDAFRLSSGLASASTRQPIINKAMLSTPAPGEYVPDSSFKARQPVLKGSHTDPKLAVSPDHVVVPSIPRRHQSFGYSSRPGSKKLTQQAPPPSYSGTGGDTVGPAGYTPNHFLSEPSRRSAVGMQRQSSRAPSILEEDLVPGPGSYDPHTPIKWDFDAAAGFDATASTTSVRLMGSSGGVAASPMRRSVSAASTLRPTELRRVHNVQLIPHRNLPDGSAPRHQQSRRRRQMNQTPSPKAVGVPRTSLIQVPSSEPAPVFDRTGFSTASNRPVGDKPWAKPDYYFRAQERPSPAFSAATPGPGGVQGPESTPGARIGKIPVNLPDPSRPTTAPEVHQPHLRHDAPVPVGTKGARFNPSRGMMSTPGPGQHDHMARVSTVSSRLTDTDDYNFGTLADKPSYWESRTLSSPYVDSQHLSVPGPGMYTSSDMVDSVGSLKSMRKSAHAPSPNAPPSFVPVSEVPFDATSGRYCLRVDRSNEPRGPGEYYRKPTLSPPAASVNPHGTSAFLDSSQRSDMLLPNAESYDAETDKRLTAKAHHRDMTDGVTPRLQSDTTVDIHAALKVPPPASRRGLSSFASTSKRSELTLRTATDDAVAPGKYTLPSKWGSRSTPNLRRHRYNSSAREIEVIVAERQDGPAPGPPEPRFKTSRLHGVDRVPGPGTYTAPKALDRRTGRSFQKETRFMQGRGDYLKRKGAVTGKKIGPGSYAVSGSMLKRSFNVKYSQ